MQDKGSKKMEYRCMLSSSLSLSLPSLRLCFPRFLAGLGCREHHVPKFGNWDQDDDVPYTQYFDTAIKGKAGGGNKAANLGDISGSFSGGASPIHVLPVRSKMEHRKSMEYAAAHETHGPFSHESPAQKVVVVVEPKRMPSRRGRSSSIGGVHSASDSPIHRDDPVKNVVIRAGHRTSPAKSRMVSVDSNRRLSYDTPVWSRPKLSCHASQNQQINDRRSSVPKFSNWDDSDPPPPSATKFSSWDDSDPPSSARSYAHVFSYAMENKPTVSANAPPIPANAPRAVSRKLDKRDESPPCNNCFCFVGGVQPKVFSMK